MKKISDLLKGRKTYIAAAVIGISAVLNHLGYTHYSEMLLTVGAAVGLVGIRNAMK